jgi:uncharacterized membrane protein
MEKIIAQGRIIYAVAIMALGVENLVCARYTDAVLPLMPFLPPIPVLVYFTGLVFIVTGLCIVANFRARLAAILLGNFFLGCELLMQIPRFFGPSFSRTVAFEILALCGGALTLARILPQDRHDSQRGSGALDKLLASGRYLFAVSSVAFGIDHFLFAHFVASLIPPWFPGALFWTYFTGTAFILAGISIATKVLDRLAATLLGIMFLIWVLFLHVPRVMKFPASHSPAEWSSLFIALAMCGCYWIIACDSPPRRRPT